MLSNKDKEQHRALKNRIVVCAAKMFRREGVRSVTMDAISAELKISKRTLYELFEDKESLLIACLIYNKQRQNATMNKVIQDSSNVLEVILQGYVFIIKYLHQTNIKFFQDIQQYPKAAAFLDAKRRQDWESSIPFFKKGIDQGIFRPDINFEIFSLMLREQIEILLNNKWHKYSIFEILEFVLFTFFRGVSTPEGVKIIDKFTSENKIK